MLAMVEAVKAGVSPSIKSKANTRDKNIFYGIQLGKRETPCGLIRIQVPMNRNLIFKWYSNPNEKIRNHEWIQNEIQLGII
jgi:hypothetical protein